MANEQIIKMAAKLYKCRDSAKSLCKMKGKDFKETVKPFIDIIKACMKKHNIKEIPALLKISETKTYQDCGVTQMYFMTAVCEILEPSI